MLHKQQLCFCLSSKTSDSSENDSNKGWMMQTHTSKRKKNKQNFEAEFAAIGSFPFKTVAD